MYQTLGPFWRAVLDVSWGRFCIYCGPFWFGPFWTLVLAVLAMGRFRQFPFKKDASSCLPPSSVVWRLSCSPEPSTFLLTVLTTRTSLTYVKRFRICVRSSAFILLLLFFYFLYIYTIKHRRPYFVGGAIQIWIDCLIYSLLKMS